SALSAPISDTLSKWKLLKNGIPTNGAAMLFSDNVCEYDNFKIKMARFLGTDKNEFIDEMRVEGNFFDLLDAGLAFCFKHLNLSGKITNRSLQREERLEIPYKALREAIINSLCHRQWEKYNLFNSIAIYDDRVEIGNPGIFPSQITPENIKEPHDSYPYNVKMAEALYRSMWLENWGSGAKRIIEACQEQGVEEPTWRWDGGFVYVTFKRPIKQEDEPLNHRPSTDEVPPKFAPTSPQARPKFAPTSPQVIQLVQVMGDQNYSIRELTELCGYADPKHFREGYIKPALAEKAIERLYADQPNHPKQKYRLTEGAKEWKKRLNNK
ncbi:MAG: ATP-dependent DNA helicase RecG, partial [Bacteroidales bacterium]|nr:ATP-dependent DNA helicase RecG [Bacteroidales bacterium]